jgi:hypothetical protein
MNRTNKGGIMKSLALAIIGLFLAGMAITCIVHGDIITIPIGIAFAAGAVATLRALRRRLAVTRPALAKTARPWKR